MEVVAEDGPKLKTGPELPLAPKGIEGLLVAAAGAAAAAAAEGAVKLNAPEVAGFAAGMAAAGAGFVANDGNAVFGSSNLGAVSGALVGTGFGCCCGCCTGFVCLGASSTFLTDCFGFSWFNRRTSLRRSRMTSELRPTRSGRPGFTVTIFRCRSALLSASILASVMRWASARIFSPMFIATMESVSESIAAVVTLSAERSALRRVFSRPRMFSRKPSFDFKPLILSR